MCGAFISTRTEESQLASRSEFQRSKDPPVELSINENKLVLNMEEVSGGIWALDNVDR
jgi:hypothetical protein